MATKSSRPATVKAKSEKRTTAPKVSRARKSTQTSALAQDSVSISRPAHGEIAARAYERFCARGFQHGHDVEDWLAAERDLSR